MKFFNVFLTTTLVLILCFPSNLIAQQQLGHVVSLEELRTALVKRTVERAANVQEIQKLLRHAEVQKRFGALANLEKIDQAGIRLPGRRFPTMSITPDRRSSARSD